MAFHGGTISYDADGNVTQRAKSGAYTIDYFWSADERLDSLTYEGSVHARYDYNALGKPVVKYTKYGSTWGGVSTYFIWDGDQLLMELDGSGNRRADYTYNPGTVDEPAAETIGATSVTAIRDFRMDASGNVIGTVDGVAVSQTLSYDAWGAPTPSGNTDNHLMWKGLLFQSDVVGIYYVRNRWYDPELGRFLSEDPIGHAGGENLYAFANNDPINGRDPSGLMQEACTRYYIERIWLNSGSVEHLGSFDSCQSLQSGGGGGAGQGPSTVSPKKAPLRCVDEGISFALAAVGDASFFLGAKEAVVAGTLAWNQRRLATMFARDAIQGLNHHALSRAYGVAAAGIFGSAIASRFGVDVIEPDNAAQLAMQNAISWRDFVPGLTTWDAGKAFYRCANQ